MRTRMNTGMRTSADVQHDLAVLRDEMNVAMAEANLASARMRLDAPGTVAFADAAAEQQAALARLGKLDRRREDLQAEARALYWETVDHRP
jgi:hypothetical protein